MQAAGTVVIDRLLPNYPLPLPYSNLGTMIENSSDACGL